MQVPINTRDYNMSVFDVVNADIKDVKHNK